MTAAEVLLIDLRSAGVTVYLDPVGELRCRSHRDVLTPELRRRVAEHRDLLRFLLEVDSAELLTLTERVDEVATEIAVAEVAVLAAKIVHLEAQQPGVEAECREAATVMAALQARFEEAERELKTAQRRSGAASQERRAITAELGNLRRQLADAMAASARDQRRTR